MDAGDVALSGAIYAKSAAVTATSADKIGDYRGGASLNLSRTIQTWEGQYIVPRNPTVVGMAAQLQVSALAFNEEMIATTMGLTASASGTLLGSGSGTATIYDINETDISKILALEWLLNTVQSTDSKNHQLWVAAGAMPGLPNLTYVKTDSTVLDLTIDCYGDSSGQFLRVLIED